jgi:hypothetical protein
MAKAEMVTAYFFMVAGTAGTGIFTIS